MTGIDYREYYQLEPNHIHVARMDRNNPDVILESSIAQGRLSGGLETVSGMAQRYDQALNYWGESWGNRGRVVVAINGYFYDPDTGIPWRGQIHSGWYAKRFDDLESGSGFVWKFDRSVFMGRCVVHRPSKQIVTYLPTGETFSITGLNRIREKDDLIIYTPQFDATTLTDDNGIEILVQIDQPMMVLSSPLMTTGIIREIRDGLGSSTIPFDHIILSANGEVRKRLQDLLKTGDEIGISHEIKHFESDCQTPMLFDWTKAYASTGGSYIFLDDGVIQSLGDLGAILRNGRTAIAYNNEYIYFIVVQDRAPFGNLGMSMVELAVFSKKYLGATHGIAMDGGGSSTMVVDGHAVNKLAPNDPKASDDNIERAVSNGWMMVVVQPKEFSTTYSIGDRISISSVNEVEMRSGPGTNFAVIKSLPAGSEVEIIEHTNQLNGVLAKGFHWWMVSVEGFTGWVAEEILLP